MADDVSIGISTDSPQVALILAALELTKVAVTDIGFTRYALTTAYKTMRYPQKVCK